MLPIAKFLSFEVICTSLPISWKAHLKHSYIEAYLGSFISDVGIQNPECLFWSVSLYRCIDCVMITLLFYQISS